MRKSLTVLAMAPVLMATQCYRAFDLQVSPGPKPMQAVFTGVRKGEQVELEELSVALCRPSVIQHVVWSASRSGKKAERTDSVTYGEASTGFFSDRAPEPLRPGGCYQVWGGGRLRGRPGPAIGSGGFRVLADGTVVNGTGELGRRLTGELVLDRAAVACRRGYRRARTSVDSAVVDDRSWAVADTTITCGFLRRRSPETIANAESTERVLLSSLGAIAAVAALLVLEDKLNLKAR